MTREEFEARLKPIDEKIKKMQELADDLKESVEAFRQSVESFKEYLKTAPKEEIREAIKEYRRLKDAENKP
jgi:uncharacterized protein YhaN